MQINVREKLVNHLCWIERKTAACNRHCSCAFCWRRGCRDSLKRCSSAIMPHTYKTNVKSCFNRNTQLYRSPSALKEETDTQEAKRRSLHTPQHPAPTDVFLHCFFTLPLLSVDRRSQVIKDCPLPAWRCWLKWSRSNYCNKGENGWGAY